MTEEERQVIVRLIDECKARGVRHFKQGDLEFSIERDTKPPANLKPLSRLKAAEG